MQPRLACLVLASVALVGCSTTTLSTGDYRYNDSASVALNVAKAMNITRMQDDAVALPDPVSQDALFAAVYKGPQPNGTGLSLGFGLGTGLFSSNSGVGAGLGLSLPFGSSSDNAPWSSPQDDNWKVSHIIFMVPTTATQYEEDQAKALQAKTLPELTARWQKALESQGYTTRLEPTDNAFQQRLTLINPEVGCPAESETNSLCTSTLTLPMPRYLAHIPAWLGIDLPGPVMVFQTMDIDTQLSSAAQSQARDVLPYQRAFYQFATTLPHSLSYSAPLPRAQWYTLPYVVKRAQIYTFDRVK